MLWWPGGRVKVRPPATALIDTNKVVTGKEVIEAVDGMKVRVRVIGCGCSFRTTKTNRKCTSPRRALMCYLGSLVS